MSEQQPPTPPNHNDFYTGYLPAPRRHTRFVRAAIPTLAVAAAALAAVLANAQRNPGNAQWQSTNLMSFTGVVVAHPYPILIDTQSNQPYLLVEVGKRGPRPQLAALHAQTVTITGWPLRRGDRHMIEIEPGDAAITSAQGSPTPPPASQTTLHNIAQAPRTFKGEILDSKCYLGAMKPGDGLAHKACATLCIRGGIPPMLFATDAHANPQHYLLLDESANPANTLVLPFVAEPVIITGRAATLASTPVILIERDAGIVRQTR